MNLCGGGRFAFNVDGHGLFVGFVDIGAEEENGFGFDIVGFIAADREAFACGGRNNPVRVEIEAVGVDGTYDGP